MEEVLRFRKVTKNIKIIENNMPHEFGGKMDYADFKQSYLELRVMKLGPGGIDGNMEERRIGWDKKCWMMLRVEKVQKMKNTKGTRIRMKNPLCRLQTIISQATGNEIKPKIARWKYEIEENNP
jgi:hypothetical protein